MGYIRSTYENRLTGDIEIHKYYPANYGAPGKTREARARPTLNAVARQNAWRKKELLRRMIQSNFVPGDMHCTLTMKKELRPADDKELRQIKRQFLEVLRKAYKKEGWELKWVMVVERGERGGIHWHMVINNCHNDHTDTAKIIAKLWKRGRPHCTPLDEDTDSYGRLAEYLLKQQDKQIKDYHLKEISYFHSRNLIMPTEKREHISEASTWYRVPKAPKGYYVASVLNGRNRYTGLPYQRYILKKLRNGEKPTRETIYIDPALWWNTEPDDEAYTDKRRKEETDAGG